VIFIIVFSIDNTGRKQTETELEIGGDEPSYGQDTRVG